MFKPATPGFLTTLAGTILLVVVSFSVPWFKTIYFLKASLAVDNNFGFITFGTLGYCLTVNGQQTCSKPAIGYNFDLNALLGNTTQVQIPEVFSKWLTYALFVHVIALILAAVASVFGLLAHVREMSMSCFSSCISGAAAFVTLIAFIFDLAIFFLARTRVRAINGGAAEIGMAVWLTLAAWVLLFISGCMFGIGRCCISKRPGGTGKRKKAAEADSASTLVGSTNLAHAEQMRLDAIKAEMERKSRQNAKQEQGLPAHEEYEIETRPLTADDEHSQNAYYDDSPQRRPGYVPYGTPGVGTGAPRRQPSAGSVLSAGSPTGYAAGYAQGPRQTAYPPQRHNTGGSAHSAQPLHSRNDLAERDIYASTTPAPGTTPSNSYLRPGPYGRNNSGSHHTQATSYQSAQSHQQYPSQYAAVDYNASQGEYDTFAHPAPPPQQQERDTYQPYYASNEDYSQHPARQQSYRAENNYPATSPYGSPSPASRPSSAVTDRSLPRQRQASGNSYSQNTYFQPDAEAPPLPIPSINTYQNPYAAPPPPPLPSSLMPGGGRMNSLPQQYPPTSPYAAQAQTPISPATRRLDPWREVSESPATGSAPVAPIYSSPPQQNDRTLTASPPSGPPPSYDPYPSTNEYNQYRQQ